MAKSLTNRRIFQFVDEFITMLADELSISKKRIFGAIRRLAPRPRSGAPPRWTDVEKRALKARIAMLSRDGRTTREIADALHLRTSQVRYLFKFRGKVPPLDFSSERVQTIIRMTQERRPSHEIGKTFGVSHVRVRQLVAQIVAEFGREALSSGFIAFKPAAQQLNMPYGTLLVRAKRGKVPCRKIGRFYYLTADEIAQIPMRINEKRFCGACGEEFTPAQVHQKVCASGACKKELARIRQRRCLAATPTQENCLPRLRELLLRLEEHTIPADDAWLTRGAAVRHSGLTVMQIQWLKLRHVLTTRQDPTRRTSRGKPVTLFAASELDIVREVYENWKK